MLAAMRGRMTLGLWLAACGTSQEPPQTTSAPTAHATVLPTATVLSTATARPTTMATPTAAPSPTSQPIRVSPASTSAPEGPCPADMVAIGDRFCIDRYEAPNREGAKPLLLQSARSGERWCRAREKRLCREREWVRACRGPDGRDFPYGHTWRQGVCNDDKTWRSPRWSAIRSYPAPAAQTETDRLDQSEPSGVRDGCVSPEGVYDLTGNAAEWVVRTDDNPTNFDHVVKGCYWARCFRPPHIPDCAYVNYAHQSPERSYEMGFRCCRDQASAAASGPEAGTEAGTR